MAKPLRLLIGLLVLLFPAFLGWHFRNPLIIPILGAIYVPLYFFGKMGAWQSIGFAPSRSAILKAVPVTFVTQCVLVGMFYLIGLGLGTLFADNEMAPSLEARDAGWVAGFAAITIPITVYIAYAERHTAEDHPRGKTAQASDKSKEGTAAVDPNDEYIIGDDDEFAVYTRVITPETFYDWPHFSRRNAVGTALTDIVDYKGDKPKRTPKEASEAMILQAEERLGVKLPETLRTIYKIQDGGGLPTYYVPSEEGAPQTYDDWITAFADDYNDLKPLADLEILNDAYMENYDPEYSDESEKEYWIPGAEKLVILTARTGYGTALDYRNGPEPGVLLYDHNKGPGKMELKTFESFDAFMGALREVDFDPVPEGEEDKRTAYGPPPNPLDADGFWATGNPGAGLSEQAWRETGEALGVTLPAALYPFYKAANGGTSKYEVALPETATEEPLKVFPTGPYIDAGIFLPAEQFVSLATLSDRLDFIDNRTPWRDHFDDPDKLIVISAAFDKAILLDYFEGGEPTVLAIPDLDKPDSAIFFGSVDDFLVRLRRFGIEKFEARNEIGDARISSRRADPSTFWLEDDNLNPVPDKVVKAFIKNWGFQDHGLPQAITDIYDVQNGGAVRFRHTPPHFINPHGYTNYDATAQQWLDAFPDGLLAMEFWQPFGNWRKEHGLAMEQSLYDFTDRVDEPFDNSSDTRLNLFVIGDHTSADARMVTLLDLSEGPFVRNRNLMTLRYNKANDTFDPVFGPMLVDNIYSGLFQTVKALKSEL